MASGPSLHGRLVIYLDMVARCGSIRKAGERLNIASSAINRQVVAFERELGTPLFQRLPRKLVLTAAGELILAHVRQTLKNYERTHAMIEELRGLHRGEISIGVMNGPAATLLPLVIEDFRRAHGNVRIHIRTMVRQELESSIRQGEIDIGLGFDLGDEAGITILASRTSHIGAVMRPDHALATRDTLSFAECLSWPLVIADDTTSIRPHLNALCTRTGTMFNAMMETNSIEVMRRMASTADVITFLTPFDIILEQRQQNLVYVPLRHTGMGAQHLRIVTRIGNANPLTAKLAETMCTVIEQAI